MRKEKLIPFSDVSDRTNTSMEDKQPIKHVTMAGIDARRLRIRHHIYSRHFFLEV
ncbi:MAG TPA: hypothetical protein VK832_09285 [Burkholderiaceae bacterium]|nr:hypothetical protein [Burkholderiaceae bacterium]